MCNSSVVRIFIYHIYVTFVVGTSLTTAATSTTSTISSTTALTCPPGVRDASCKEKCPPNQVPICGFGEWCVPTEDAHVYETCGSECYPILNLLDENVFAGQIYVSPYLEYPEYLLNSVENLGLVCMIFF